MNPLIRFKEHAVPAVAGRLLLDQLLDHNIPVMYLCMGGSCRMCRMQVVAGAEHLEPKKELESRHILGADERLACQAVTRGSGDVVLDQD